MAEPLPIQIQMKRVCSEVDKVKFLQHLSPRDFSETQTRFAHEPQTGTVVNKGYVLLTGVLLDKGKSVGASKYKSRPAFEPRNNWFDNDCQNRRPIYRKKLREAKKNFKNYEKKAVAKEYKLFRLQKKFIWESDRNEVLREKA